MNKRLSIFVKGLVYYIIFILVGFGITGRVERQHNVISADTTVTVNNEKYAAVDLVKKYQPILFSEKKDPAPVDMKYEITEQENAFVITYHTEWEDEDHPNFIQDIAWRVFRFSYFGFNLNDSEYIQVDIDKKTGNLAKAKFDSPDVSKSSLWAHDKRITTELDSKGQGLYDVYKIKNDEKTLTSEYTIKGNVLTLEIKNWNHLYEVAENTDEANKVDFKLTYLDGDVYKKYKYARRHFGDIHTAETVANAPIIFFVSLIFVTYFVILIRDYTFSEKKNKKQSENA
ncbi:hypothetical protein [Chondrinema litorale]|uniref:hypothetical protein n=1 Tax=Chondrinema litorale TaxID=2994555 RepID=UPI0025429178|nr:hypothetical protein [Chondrinema litorale]UZR96009.1 hypothetical protein OQ292_09330 [Chondrinema litorale]